MKNKISVVVVTRNRQADLKHCLGSLASQSVGLDELIVVDNNSTDNTRQIVINFSKLVKYPVRYVSQIKVGYAHVYNRGLKEARHNWVAFIDDDCVAQHDWYAELKKSIASSSSPRLAVVLGRSDNYFPHSPAACAMQYSNNLWKDKNLDEDKKILNYEILDSRNIAYRKTLLKKHKLNFDKRLTLGSEDSDLGLRIQQSGLIAIYDPNVKALHKEPSTIAQYLSKKKKYEVSSNYYKKSKRSGGIQEGKISWIRKKDLFGDVCSELSFANKIVVLILIYIKFYKILPL